MHKKLIEHSTDAQLRDFIYGAMGMIKATNYELYQQLEEHLYHEIYGCHFNEWLSKQAVEEMHNEDGTTGEHWTLDQTTNVAKQYNVVFNHFNEYDWYYVMNMIYSDFYGAVNNDISSYVKLTRKFLEDKDAPKGKAYKYYMGLK